MKLQYKEIATIVYIAQLRLEELVKKYDLEGDKKLLQKTKEIRRYLLKDGTWEYLLTEFPF